MRFNSILLAIVALMMAGCGSGYQAVQPGEVPTWVNRLPETKGKLYAVGLSGATYFVEDGKLNAADNARKELAKALSVRVQALSLSMQENRNRSENEISSVTVTSWATDIVLLYSQILEIWIDENARVPNSQPGTIYALASIDLSTAQEAIKTYMKSDNSKK